MTQAAVAHGNDGDEAREAGHVRWRVYRAYGQSVGRWTVALVVVSLLLMQVGQLPISHDLGG